ncbi:MAG: AAA family ATPase, partial [Oribacterium sp.]|nr:AAA family ATPase [Oribacterium sp.]
MGHEQRNLPIGIQSFEKIIENNNLYIDKTEFIYR